MSLCRFIECRCDYFRIDAAAHVGYFFRAFVNKENHDVGFGVILGNCVGDVFQKYGLTCLRRCYYQTSLSFSNGGEHVDHTCGNVA